MLRYIQSPRYIHFSRSVAGVSCLGLILPSREGFLMERRYIAFPIE
jgi:hypothetical protein